MSLVSCLGDYGDFVIKRRAFNMSPPSTGLLNYFCKQMNTSRELRVSLLKSLRYRETSPKPRLRGAREKELISCKSRVNARVPNPSAHSVKINIMAKNRTAF